MMHLFHKLYDHHFGFRMFQINKGDDMEVRVSHVPCNGINDVVFIGLQNALKPWKKPRKVLGFDDDVINERCRGLSLGMLVEKLEACPTYCKVLFFLFFVFGDAPRNGNARKFLPRFLRLFPSAQPRIARELCKQYELGEPSEYEHPELGKKSPCQRKDVFEFQYSEKVPEETENELQCPVVITLKALWLLGCYLLNNAR